MSYMGSAQTGKGKGTVHVCALQNQEKTSVILFEASMYTDENNCCKAAITFQAFIIVQQYNNVFLSAVYVMHSLTSRGSRIHFRCLTTDTGHTSNVSTTW